MSRKKSFDAHEIKGMLEQSDEIQGQILDVSEAAGEQPDHDLVKSVLTVRELKGMKDYLDRKIRPIRHTLERLGLKQIPYKPGSKELSRYLELKGLSIDDAIEDDKGNLWEGPMANLH